MSLVRSNQPHKTKINHSINYTKKCSCFKIRVWIKVDHFFALCNLPPSAWPVLARVKVLLKLPLVAKKIVRSQEPIVLDNSEYLSILSYNVISLSCPQHVTTGKVWSPKYHKEISCCVICSNQEENIIQQLQTKELFIFYEKLLSHFIWPSTV